MAPVPALRLPTAGTTSASTTPRSTARSGDAFSVSARHLLKPQVGVAAQLSALGDYSPPWATGKPSTLSFGRPAPTFSDCDGREPYNVGKSRARAHLKLALSTEDKEAQLRRLGQALESNRFDRTIRRELENAENQARELALKLGKDPASARARQTEDEQPGKAASSPKSKKRSSKPTEKEEVEMSSTVRETEEPSFEYDAEMEAAATKIQAIQRGKQTRKNLGGE
mmetsp:Transcript_32269/g.57056  ORF Transcript_32269/g.57056 Transcript_32269/m.57056 type:complete len:226 (+) Transcript_32269:125-802(+)